MAQFIDTEIAFKIKSNFELKKAYWLFRLLSSKFLVKTGKYAITFVNKIGFPVGWIVKPTVYKQFCGGEKIEDCVPVIIKLARFNVKSVLDYSVEGKDNDEDIGKALNETLKAVEFAGNNPDIPFSVFKPTAFANHKALEELSATGQPSAKALSEGEKFRKRIDLLCNKAYSFGIPIMIDAEDSFYQDFIDKVVMEMMMKYNHKQAIVFNTYQMYRWDRLKVLQNDLDKARKNNFFLGAKFVRGAYMERERERALKMNYRDPIHPDKESTDRDFNEALKISTGNIDRISIFNGTHNEYSCSYLAMLMNEHNIKPDDNRVWFSQLYGMSDHISFNLAQKGYNVAKYLPYGPVRHVLPYLIRRTEENTSVAGQTGRELSLIIKELNRRKNEQNHPG